MGFEREGKTEINPRGRTKIVTGDRLIFVATKRPNCAFS